MWREVSGRGGEQGGGVHVLFADPICNYRTYSVPGSDYCTLLLASLGDGGMIVVLLHEKGTAGLLAQHTCKSIPGTPSIYEHGTRISAVTVLVVLLVVDQVPESTPEICPLVRYLA